MVTEQEHLLDEALNEPLAIIGMNCQFPGVDSDIEDVDAFNEMLLKAISPITEIPSTRWDVNEYYDPDRNKTDKIISRKGGFLNNIHLFDAAFFKISALEAKQMDPQHRLFLEVAIRAINHANIPLESLNGTNTAVYCGMSTYEYSQLNYKDNINFNAYTAIGMAPSAAAGRLSHFLNLKGPSITVDTACSSSLSAIYLASSALRAKQCDLAIVGGIHLSLNPEGMLGFSKANMLSAKGQCASFDSQADGFVCSEGCGIIIVQRLSDALKAKNKIHALIKSIVMNQDGDGTGLAAPNIESQIAMHEIALREAHLRASDIDYIEAHGSGTVLGDTVEFNAIRQVHEGQHTQENPLIIGAVKSILGHTISSSGIASLLKVIGSFKREVIPPNLHYSEPNKEINPQAIPAVMPSTAHPFPYTKNKKRCAQVANFSFSGTNVSAIIEEGVLDDLAVVSADNTELKCFVLSAHSEHSLKEMLNHYPSYLQNTNASLNDICCTLINCRDHFRFRCALLVTDKESLMKKLVAHDYEITKVLVNKKRYTVNLDGELIYKLYLTGENIKLSQDAVFNKSDLPLYSFDRKDYWHESRKENKTSWLTTLSHHSKEEQISLIKEWLHRELRTLLNKETIEENSDLAALGINKESKENLERKIKHTLACPISTPLPDYLSVDKLARYLQQYAFPSLVQRQPSINILNSEPIAIIGMSCRYPQAESVNEFLTLLNQGKSGMIDIPLERWDNEKYYDEDVDTLGKLYIRQLGLLDNVKDFDADFFNISPREAKLMAPQLRLFMEGSYHALEDANLSLDNVKDSKTGVFVGIGTNEYPDILAEEGISLEELNIYFATGNVLNAVAGRVAYSFDFHGPIQVIDTACSSSMTAIHNACTSLQAGDCDLALAGGINILLAPYSNITLCKAKMLSPESRCKTFSDDADGYARSEGYGILVLKRLSQAIAEQDNILAVIKGSAINSDGKSGGFTVPNGTAQEEVIRSALAKAALAPDEIDYIEAHGTGTPLADPIEANTLMTIFADAHSAAHPLYLSSVKTNIGHSESASGVAGIIKGVLSLQEKQLFKHLNFRTLNPGIELRNTVIPLETTPWDKKQGLRALGVSSFGFSGANAHVVLQEAPSNALVERTLPEENILVLSAKSKESLELLLASYAQYLLSTPHEWADICYTAAHCRAHFLFRVALIAPSKADAAQLIKEKKYEVHVIKKEQGSPQPYLHVQQMQEAYQQGNKIDWAAYYTSFSLRFLKVKLPLYEFVGKEYWYEEKDKIKDRQLPTDWSFQLQWQQQAYDKNNAKIVGKNWLLIGSSDLTEELSKQGLTLVLEQEIDELSQLDGIIFNPPTSTSSNLEDFLEQQKSTLKTLLSWIRKLYENGLSLQVVVLTSQAVAELSREKTKLNHVHAALLGFCKTLILELPQYKTILLDLAAMDLASKASIILQELEYNHGSSYEHQIAYRENKRLAPRLKKKEAHEGKRPLYSKGRYLITGGTGGLGFISAQSLLSAGAKEVVLIARHVDKEEFQKNIKRISSYYPGRSIKAISLDITNKEKLANLLIDLNIDGQLKGIIHTAGATIKAPLTEHQDDDVDYVFAAKVKGAWYLHELSKDLDLDFFIVYSSISSAFGSNKESVYSGANSCLDLLIAERHSLGLVGTAVQWGPWGEVGMAQKRSRDESIKKALISNEQGHHFLKFLFTTRAPELAIISPAYLQFMLDFVPQPYPLFYKQLEHDLTHKELVNDHNMSTWLQTYLELKGEQRFIACKAMITLVCKDILDASTNEELDDDEGFFELGFDSLMVAELASELKKKLEPALRVMVNIGFNYPTINKLSRYIEEELNNKLLSQVSIPKTINNPMDDIAVIGMSCSFPQAPNIHAFEQLLAEGKNAMRDIPKERWDNSLYYDPDRDVPGKSYVTKLGLIDHIKEFDAAFFGISPREAKLIDPQQRVFLECCYTAIEQANYPLTLLKGSATGVFAGAGPNEYFPQLEKLGFSNEELSMYSITGNVVNLIPGRVAYFFDFKGPTLTVDTACSSSLVAIHYACQSLKTGEIDYALAGGVNILLSPESNITLCKAHALSPDGQCKTFDAGADGYARAEGCGVVLLKRLSDAVRDNDTILAVIKASAVNNDGKSAGLTVPNGKSQEEVMLKALKQAQLSSAEVSYIEAHGTGTPLGDPIEAHAITQVYGLAHNQDNPLYLGAVKTNIGHLESASGIAGVIKTILSLKNKKIYKHLHFKRLNTNIYFNDTHIPMTTMDWHVNSGLRSAGVNAFGFSGTNAHLIMQEYSNPPRSQQHRVGRYLLTLSARSKNSLESLVTLYQDYLEKTSVDFADVCFTAAVCRTHYPYRLVVVASTAQEAREHLSKGQFALSFGEDNTNNTDPIVGSLLSAYLKDKEVDWFAFFKSLNIELKKVELPTYPFNRIEFWPEKDRDEPPVTQALRVRPSVLEQSTVSLLMTLKAQSPEERIATLETLLTKITGQILEMKPEQITPQHELFSLGLDSLMAVDIRSRIHDQLRCPALSISMEYFINKPRIATIANVIAKELAKIFSLSLDEYGLTEQATKDVLVTPIQYPLWAINQYNGNFNLGMQLRLAGELNREYLQQAFAAVVKNNAAFWVEFNKELPTQTLRRQGKLEVIFKDFSEDEKVAELDNWFYTNIINTIPLEKPPLLRVYLYKINDALHEVHVIIPHIIAEGKSCDLIMQQFKSNYELLVARKPLPVFPEENSYFSYVQSNNYHCLKNFQEKVNFWKSYNQGLSYLYLGPENHLPDAAILQEHYMWNYPLTSSVMEQFIAWHKTNNLNISNGLIALTHIVLYALGAKNRLPLTLIHTGREGEQYQSTIGLFAEYKRINNIINDNNQFIESIQFIEEELLRTAPYQQCPFMLKEKKIKGERLHLGEYIVYLRNKLKDAANYKKLGIPPYLTNLYLAYLSRVSLGTVSYKIRLYLHRWFGRSILKPAPLHTLISVTSSFFVKEAASENIADLQLSYPNHFAYADRPIGNKSLWVYFTRDQQGVYQLSLNGPLTKECQDEMASLFNQLMAKILEDDKLRIIDLINAVE